MRTDGIDNGQIDKYFDNLLQWSIIQQLYKVSTTLMKCKIKETWSIISKIWQNNLTKYPLQCHEFTVVGRWAIYIIQLYYNTHLGRGITSAQLDLAFLAHFPPQEAFEERFNLPWPIISTKKIYRGNEIAGEGGLSRHLLTTWVFLGPAWTFELPVAANF